MFGATLINIVVPAWLIIAIVTLLPASLTIAYAEIKAKQNISFFIGMGIFIALLPTAPIVVISMFGGGQFLWPLYWLSALTVAGTVAGIVYWAIAGRNSGKWHRRAAPASAAPGG